MITPELPRVLLDTVPPVQTGKTLTVAKDGSDLQAQINLAQPGDTIEIPTGTTCKGNFVLPAKPNPAKAWIVIRAAGDDIVAAGTRVSPGQPRAKLLAPNCNAAISTKWGAAYWRLCCLEISVSIPEPSLHYGLVTFGDGKQATIDAVAHDLVVDRCWIHGSKTLQCKRGVTLNGARCVVVDSYINEIHVVGQDSQAIGGWNGPGPYKIVNNYLEASTENVMFGGAMTTLPGVIPSDIEIRGNYLFKPRQWQMSDPHYCGTRWCAKNLLELKSAQRVLVSNNRLENSWVDGQVGFAVLCTPRTNNGQQPDVGVVTDVTFEHNLILGAVSGFAIAGRDGAAPAVNGVYPGLGARIWLHHNWLQVGDKTGDVVQVGMSVEDVTIEHNTAWMTNGRSALVFAGSLMPAAVRLIVRDNVLGGLYHYPIVGSSSAVGMKSVTKWAPDLLFTGNVLLSASGKDCPLNNNYPLTNECLPGAALDEVFRFLAVRP